ncbi:MAG: HD domain-containing protein [Acidobacteriota bacterium]
MQRDIRDVNEAYAFLRELGAPEKLLLPVALVGEAAEIIIKKLKSFNLAFDERLVRIGVALHDTGKILHADEFFMPGEKHEGDGETLLLSKGIDPKLARICKSHGQWEQMECSVEELLVALVDKLWKGKREEGLESKIIERLAKQLNLNQWDLYIELDSCFEDIAVKGNERLTRSKDS